MQGCMTRCIERLVVLLTAVALACSDGARAGALAAGEAQGDVDLATPAAQLTADTLARRADSLVRGGRYWRATALLAPRLTTPTSAVPELRIAGARAAAGWDGWEEVERILRGAPWLDAEFGGEGHELLARAALERGTDALPDARLAVAAARDDAARVTRRVLLARAHDRAKAPDSAAVHYLAAASRLAGIADWLRLRAAGVTGDSAARRTLLVRVTLPAAKARVTLTDAQARERGGDLAGAARAFRTAGADGSAFRVEAMSARDASSRATLAGRIATYLASATSNAEIRQALEVLDNLGPPSVREEVVVSRAAAKAGVVARAVSGFARAAAAEQLSATDRMVYASVLARAGRTADAARIYASLSDDAALAPAAAYQRARMLVQSGQGAAARAALESTAERHAAAHGAAAPALLLLADLQVDDGQLGAAEASLRQLLTQHPSSAQAPLARFRYGLLQWNSSPAAAAATFDTLVALHPGDEEALAAKYWAARAYQKLGRSAEATERWRAIVAASPLSYYAMRASQRLGTAGWVAPAGSDTIAQVAAVDQVVDRIVALRRVGMDVEARFEIDALVQRAEDVPAEAGAAAQALLSVGESSRALRVALAAIEKGPATRGLYRIAFPIVHEDALVEEARRNGLDPALVAGLIRQESSWNPRAISPASARGLMQLMPSVGASIAASRRYPLWNTALLLDPDVSLELGTRHLASSLTTGTPPERALAAYNAGGSRLRRWVQRPGSEDAELFTEWIPYTETRDYVRVVLRNAKVYRALMR